MDFYPSDNRIFLLTVKKEYVIVKNVFGKAYAYPVLISAAARRCGVFRPAS